MAGMRILKEEKMKKLLEIAKENPRFYADMAVQANISGKILKVEKDILIQTEPDKTSDFVQAELIRTIRNKKLQESDWTQGNDSPLNAEEKKIWADYRQKLRDLPDHINIPNVTFPVSP